MTPWLPWAAAFVAFNLAFDLQVRWAGDRFVAEQLARSRAGQPVALIRDAFRPQVRHAALIASAASALVLATGLVTRRRFAASRRPRPWGGRR